MPRYASHSRLKHPGSDSRQRERSRTMRQHTAGVTGLVAAAVYGGVAFGTMPGIRLLGDGDDASSLKAFLEEVTRLHDLGKLSRYFQAYVLAARNEVRFDPKLKGHTHLGALVSFRRLHRRTPELAYLAAYLIAHHHRSLSQPMNGGDDPLYFDDAARERRNDISAKQLEALPADEAVAKSLGLAQFSSADTPVLTRDDTNDLLTTGKYWRYRSKKRRDGLARGLDTFFCFNYLFSLLVEADKLDASATPAYTRLNVRPGTVDAYVAKITGRSTPAPLPPAGAPIPTDRDGRRNQARADVLAQLDTEGVLSQKLFTLTAPTGIGKTLTGLDFALGLRERLPGQAQIIVGLPFVNIIEQTLAVYTDALRGRAVDGGDIKVLGHYQFADVLGDTDPDAASAADEDGLSRDYAQARMALDTWQADVVITTFVQLFESIATGRNAALKKFNHLAGAILLLDEVQSLPPELAPFVGTLLHYCTRCLGTRVIMMTATQPLIVDQANGVLANCQVGHRLEKLELLERWPDYYAGLDRTRLVPMLDEPFVDEEVGSAGDVDAFDFDTGFAEAPAAQTAAAKFAAHLRERTTLGESQLVVVNTVNRSLAVFEALREAYAGEVATGQVHIYYLSTNVLPVQREARIEEVSEALHAFRQNGRDATRAPCVLLVATQVVEAGVDLDFDRGWRDFAPVSNLVQVAGRVNRNGSLGRTADVYVVRFAARRNTETAGSLRDDAELIYGFQQYRATQNLMSEVATDIRERDYANVTQAFFRGADPGRGGSYGESETFFKAAELLDYGTIGKFRLIKELDNMTQVYIPWDPEGREGEAAAALEAYETLCTAAVDPEERRVMQERFERHHGAPFRKRLLNISKHYTDGRGLDDLRGAAEILVVDENKLGDHYSSTTGWQRDFTPSTHLIL